jgi:hypothetical protein
MMLPAEEMASRVPDITRVRGECPNTYSQQISGIQEVKQTAAHLREEQ